MIFEAGKSGICASTCFLETDDEYTAQTFQLRLKGLPSTLTEESLLDVKFKLASSCLQCLIPTFLVLQSLASSNSASF